jgi:oligopeptide/dipeptide ABC transporter ATP-binding protein
MEKNLLVVENLKKYFTSGKPGLFQPELPPVKAVDGVSFSVRKGETLGIVGESGCGKSTLARTIIRLYDPDEGKVWFDGENITQMGLNELNAKRRNFQIIFQDPYASLNPRMTVGDIVAEPLTVFKNRGLLKSGRKEIKDKASELLGRVGLSPRFVNRYPHEFSGGQRQRIGIARSLALNPKLVICDEPVSALDVSIQSQIINLLEHLQNELKLTYLFISHDLAVVRHISRRIAVMYLGKIVEIALTEAIFNNTKHPYTKALLSNIPVPDPALEKTRKRIILEGDIPSPSAVIPGCRFKTRCYMKTEICETVEPPLEDKGNGHLAACHHSNVL